MSTGQFQGDVCSLIQCTEDGPYVVERVVCGHVWGTPIGSHEHLPNPSDSSPLHRHSIVYLANGPFHPGTPYLSHLYHSHFKFGVGVMHVKKVQHIYCFWDTDNYSEQNYKRNTFVFAPLYL